MESENITEKGGIDIKAIIDDVLRELKRLFWIVLVLMVLLAAVFYVRAKRSYVPYYTTSATFTINVGSQSSSYFNSAMAAQLEKTFPSILTSGVLKEVVCNDLGLSYLPGTISAVALSETNLFTISVSGRDPETIYQILESVVKNYPEVAQFIIGDTVLYQLDSTGVPTTPTNPFIASTHIEKGAVLGLLLGLAIVVFVALTRTTIRRADDVNKLTNIKYLGSVPEVRFKKRSQNRKNFATINNRVVSHSFIESMRYVRTRIDKIAKQNGIKTIIVTSAMPGEGKTTIAANIALSLARKENKVILIDCDFRNPCLAKTLRVSRSYNRTVAGVLDVLSGAVALDDALRFYEDNLFVLFGGEPKDNIDTLLESPMLSDLIKKLRTKADYVIIDAAPSAILSDATVLAKNIDAAVFVVRQEHASKNRILEGLENFSVSNTPIMGYVFNCVTKGFASYGYGKYGYGKYGSYGKYGAYGGYGAYESNSKRRSKERA